MNKRLNWLAPLLVVVAILAAGFGLVHYESEYLWKVQELNLFLPTSLFLKQQMVTSGWLLTWLGTWFTEFFYYPAVGVAMLCGLCVLLALLIVKALRIPLRWATLTLVPIAMILLSDVDLGYWVYYLKLRGHFFAFVLGLIFCMGAVWLFRLLPARWWVKALFAVVSTAVFYPLIGFYGLLATLLMAVMVWHSAGMRTTERLAVSLLALLAIVVVPLVCYRFVFHETNILNIFLTGLPLFRIDDQYPAYYLPYAVTALWLTVCAALSGSKWHVKHAKAALYCLAQAVLIGVLAFAVVHFWYRDDNFHRELRMQQCLESEDWEGILQEARNIDDEPTRAIVMMKNLALFRLGRQGDEMYHYRTGAKASDTPIPVNMTQIVGRSIYYNYGQVNFCYRWCLEDGVEFGWRAEHLKYLTRCALVNGEYVVARKYIDLLKRTRYHSRWAKEQEHFLNNEQALRADKAYGPVFHMLLPEDQLNSDNSLVEHFLMNKLAATQSDDPLLQEACLLAAIWTKDIQNFWPQFFQYAKLHPTIHMPKHYQEVAYLYGNLEHEVDISKMPFDKDVVDNFHQFMQQAERCAGMSEERMRPIFYPRFGKTFYYEYFLVRNQKLY